MKNTINNWIESDFNTLNELGFTLEEAAIIGSNKF